MNKEQLNEAIIREAFEQGVDVPETEGMTNKELTNTLEQLMMPPAPPESSDEDVPPAPPESSDEDVPPAPPAGYVIAPGKSITCLKGILTEGNEILPGYVNGGDDSFELLKQQKYIVEAEK